MDYENNNEAIVTEQNNYATWVLLTLVAMVVVFSSVSYLKQGYVFKLVNSPIEATLPISSYGLDTTMSTDRVVPSGYLKFENLSLDTNSITGTQFVYDFETSTVKELPEDVLNIDNDLSPDMGVSLASYDKDSVSNSLQPTLFNRVDETVEELPNLRGYFVQNVSVSPDKTMYAYSYQSEAVSAKDSQSLLDWNIAIHAFDTDEVIILNGAAKLVWVVGTPTFVFLQTDGIYQYNVETGEKTLLSTIYAPYTISDDVAIAPNGSQLILTSPSSNLVSLMNFTNNTLTEFGRIIGMNTGYTSPYFSPDSLFYGVVATSFTVAVTTGTPVVENVKRQIEIREVNNKKVMTAFDVTDQGQVKILRW